jgi:hypothetical protein
MRKIQKQRIPFSNRYYKELRKENTLKTIVDQNGHEIVLNLEKHFLFNQPYVNKEYNIELMRYGISKRMAEEKKAQEPRVAEAIVTADTMMR